MGCKNALSENILIESLQVRVVTGEITHLEYLSELHELFMTGEVSESAWKQGLHQVALPLTSHHDSESASEEKFVTGWAFD